MGNRILPLTVDTVYHIYNRGFNKQTLFYDAHDYRYFLQAINRYRERFKNIRILSHCLLPNHFHFLLTEDSSNLPGNSASQVRTESSCSISSFMQKLQQSYAMYFTKRYGDSVKKGLKMPVFEGRFQAREVLDEAYLGQLVVYIEHNAVKHEIVNDVKDWSYSSWEPGKAFDLQQDFFSDFD